MKSILKTTLVAAVAACFSATASAGTWYDDWETKVETIEIHTPYYGGNASCHTNKGTWLSEYIFKSYSSFVTLRSTSDFLDSCLAFLSQQGIETSYQTKTTKIPVSPYPTGISTERLGCVGAQRRVLLTINNTDGGGTMKIYSAASPSYAQNLVYSGPAQTNAMVTVNASTNNVNLRVKMDNGSSSYLSMGRMSCTDGTPIPLD